jgi:hypothetical protein
MRRRDREADDAALRPTEKRQSHDQLSTGQSDWHDADRDQPSAGVTQNHQAVEQLERDRAYDEKIQRGDPGGMIAQERSSNLGTVVGGA